MGRAFTTPLLRVPAGTITLEAVTTSVTSVLAMSSLAVNVGTMLISLVDAVFGLIEIGRQELDPQRLLGWVNALVLFMMGMPWSVGELLGARWAVNELVAFFIQLAAPGQLIAPSHSGEDERQHFFEGPARGGRVSGGFCRCGGGVHLSGAWIAA